MMVRRTAPLPQLRIEVLGPPRVVLGERPVTFPRHKALALLVYLAVSRRAHSRDALAALLGDAATDAAARTRFRTVLGVLHKAVGDHLEVGRQTVALAPDRPVWLDLAQLEAAMRGGATPTDAVALYRDDFLAGLSVTHAPEFECWLVASGNARRPCWCAHSRA
jgi:DNA-binding SARP family transcriptional activator